MLISTESAISAKNNHHFDKISPTHLHPQIPPSIGLNRSVNETTCTTVTTIPCHHIKQKHTHQKTKVHPFDKESVSSKKHHHTVPTSFLHQPLHSQKDSSNLCNIFHSLSFHNIPSKIPDDISIISNDYQKNSDINNEQFQVLKKQFHTYLNDIQFNILSRVIQLLSLCIHLNNEQIKDLLHSIGYSNITMDDIHRITANDERIFVNEKFQNLRTILNDYKKAKD